MATKKELRKIYRQRRLDIPAATAVAWSGVLCRQVISSNEFAAARTVHLFLPIKRFAEVDTYPLLDAVLDAGKTAAVSVSDMENGTMNNYAIGQNTLLVENDYGIPEPAEPDTLPCVAPADIDLIIIPLLAYDTRGLRVGYGRGFYDRFLRQCRRDAVKAGVSFFPPEAVIDDTTPDDMPLDCCFTPEGKTIFKLW